MSIRLSVNVNKVATLRNSRGGDVPNVLDAVRTILGAGARGITVHPRADERHIRGTDVRELAEYLEPRRADVELNIEGDPRRDLMDLVCKIRPQQCTLVPVRVGEVTSEAGWSPATDNLAPVVQRLQAAGVRVSLFVDPDEAPIRWAKEMGAERVELYTEPFARAFAGGVATAEASVTRYSNAATLAVSLGLGVNAGHDLDLDNLPTFQRVPGVSEVSIGHALISRALYVGLDTVVREYLDLLAG
jgi:pyridoxine 5-phosphate synthase